MRGFLAWWDAGWVNLTHTVTFLAYWLVSLCLDYHPYLAWVISILVQRRSQSILARRGVTAVFLPLLPVLASVLNVDEAGEGVCVSVIDIFGRLSSTRRRR